MKKITLALAALAASSAHALTGNISAGKQAFAPCAECHQVGPEARSGFGPQLNRLFGRRAGSSPDYKYSKAMMNATIVWQERTLAEFIKNPDRTVPGTRMRFLSFGYDEQKIVDLLAYLRTFDTPH
ncbi:MAG TPA: c-type cytochrome [Burkholderiaceae bacterium]|jgi:cytochrome c